MKVIFFYSDATDQRINFVVSCKPRSLLDLYFRNLLRNFERNIKAWFNLLPIKFTWFALIYFCFSRAYFSRSSIHTLWKMLIFLFSGSSFLISDSNSSEKRLDSFVKVIRNDQTPNVVFTPSIYKTPWEKRNLKLLASNKFCAMVNSVFTRSGWCVKWMATTALEAKTLKFQ